MHDIIIIGAGPAGMSAALTAVKLKLKVLVVAKEFSIPSPEAEELGVFDAVNLQKEFLADLKKNAKYLEAHLKQEVLSLEKNVVSFSVETKQGQIFYGRSAIVCSGEDSASHEGNTGFDLISFKDSKNKIKVDSQMVTNVPGLFAAGGVVSGTPGNAFIGAGEGARAVFSAREFNGK